MATQVELAAPAGDPEALRAAVNHGADAVYLGLQRFSARARAANFTLDQLRDAVALCRPRGVRIYVALNTLAFDDELDEVAALVSDVALAGADALIVQDLGVAALARQVCPDLPLHASTQTSVGTIAGARVLEDLGFRRLVVPRELSLAQLRRLREGTSLELEVFVHGAQCISWSGQCLASLARGGRSGNRGACAQPCRLPYEVLADDGSRPSHRVDHPLSPGDLCAAARIGELARSGVASFKIEGRLKRPEYVASAVFHYRQLLDRISRNEPAALDESERRALLQPFHRSPTLGYLDGPDHRALVRGGSPGSQGLPAARIAGVEGAELVLDGVSLPLAAGDGVAIEGRTVSGGRVHAVRELPGGRLQLRMGPEFRLDGVRPGQRVSRTDDPALTRRLRLGIEGRSRQARPRRHPVDARMAGRAAEPLRLSLADGEGRRVEVLSAMPLEVARTRPLEPAAVRERLSRMGQEPFRVARLDWRVEGGVTLPPAEINRMRREACTRLAGRRQEPPSRVVETGARAPVGELSGGEGDPRVPEGLAVLCRTRGQVEAVLDTGGIATLIADPAVPEPLAPMLAAARARGVFCVAALPRTELEAEPALPGELSAADGVLIRSLGRLRDRFRGDGRALPAALGDANLNAVNAPAAAHLLRAGLATLAPGADLAPEGVLSLAGSIPPSRLEVPLVVRLPLFHTVHCLYAARLAGAPDRSRCGDPCRRARLSLRDREGRLNPVLVDTLCRNTVFDAVPRDWRGHLSALWSAGIRRFRVELVDEEPAAASALVTGLSRSLDSLR